MEKAGDTLVHNPSECDLEPGLHVIFANYFYEPDLRSPDELLHRYSTIRPLAKALCEEGVQVTVLQRFHANATVNDNGVRFIFCVDDSDANLRKWQIPRTFHDAVRDACVTSRPKKIAVHVNGLLYPLQTRALRSKIPAHCAIVAQHHAERPGVRLRRILQKWGLRSVDGFFFAALTLADRWIEYGLISEKQKIFEVMEGSNCLRWKDRATARTRTGLNGEPVVLWVGDLTANKDPETVLEGFERVLSQLPKARLYMAYRRTDLLQAVCDRVASSPSLRNAVTLLGSLSHSHLEDIYNSADYFVLGSHYEGSGFALAEAMACGVVPIVTAIPSFLAMTDGGRAGACWSVGDSHSFASTFIQVISQGAENISKEVSAFFDRQLSYRAIARISLRAYNELSSRRMQAKL